ncbi:MAG: pitrilysin family protein [Bacillota bacterium]|nr:pitrilysin family protein [Bacillota bacterium]
MTERINVKRFRQEVLFNRLPNGLPVYFFPKKNYNKSFAMFATNYGSADSKFVIKGGTVTSPGGVAHFLEHKLFDQPDGNALNKFASLGASPNAFTSQVMTAYHFESTEKFYDNLEILLDFVSNPYFTKESVDKEQGIIGQEIGMVEDTPSWKAYNLLFEALFNEHTVKNSIIGTVESIAKITPEILYQCHSAFYSPENMVLVAAGDQDMDRILELAERHTKKENCSVAGRIYGEEKINSASRKKELRMQLSMPIFMLGFKTVPPEPSKDRFRNELLGELSAEYLLGASSKLYQTLYTGGLINRSFEWGYSLFPKTAVFMAGGESREPERVFELVLKEAGRIKTEGMDPELFESIKKASAGIKIRTLDSEEALCSAQVSSYFGGAFFLDFPGVYDSIGKDDVADFIERNIREESGAISVVYPNA